jgi:hypothetical protein
MTKRILAIAFIYCCTALAWAVLGSTIYDRTNSSEGRLKEKVVSTWGTRQAQEAPAAFSEKTETRIVNGRPEAWLVRVGLPLEETRAAVRFALDYRQKGLLWYSTYGVAFDARYRFTNPTPVESVSLELKLPASQALYDDLRVSVNGSPAAYRMQGQSIVTPAKVPAGDSVVFAVAYRSQGLDEWRYRLGGEVAEARNFRLTMRTDFDRIDFPENTLSPTEKRKQSDGWELEWRYTNLVSGFQIAMAMPQKLQPGPLAGRISLFAPVSLLFFFAVMFLIATLRGIDLHPMNYAFLAAAFFAFHLLLAYLVDHVSIHLAFAISSVVSILLVTSYLRLVVGPRFALREAALAQLTYLVLFSYAFFFEGFTGLTITIGSILTLFVAMQLTGKVRWSEVFAVGGVQAPSPSSTS